MKIGVRVNQIFKNEKRLRAFVTIYLGDEFLVTGVRVIEAKNGLCVMMPSRKDSRGEYKDVCFPTNAQLRKDINTNVLTAYEQYIKEMEDNDIS